MLIIPAISFLALILSSCNIRSNQDADQALLEQESKASTRRLCDLPDEQEDNVFVTFVIWERNF